MNTATVMPIGQQQPVVAAVPVPGQSQLVNPLQQQQQQQQMLQQQQQQTLKDMQATILSQGQALQDTQRQLTRVLEEQMKLGQENEQQNRELVLQKQLHLELAGDEAKKKSALEAARKAFRSAARVR